MTFLDGSTPLCTVPVGTNGQAALTTTQLTLGDHTITATFSGTGTAAPSSATIVQQVDPAPAPPAQPSTLPATR